MDCNMRSPFLWDLDNLILPNSSKTENDDKQLTTNGWEIEKGEGIESILPCFNGLDRVSTCSTTSFWHTPVSKSSQSTSTNSSSPEAKQCILASESSPGDSCSNIVKTSTTLEASVASAESDLSLKLGKRTHSEELWSRNSNAISAVSVKMLTPPVVVARKKSKSCGQSMQVPRCQIDGCELDLSSAKDYHRKHRVCEKHSKCPKVTVGGVERRFCQQCSRFHAVSEFDETKRSCRKRLSHHNARRRKPQGVFPFTSDRMYDGRHNTNMLWNGLSLNTDEKFSWDNNYDTKPTQTESGFTLSFQRGNGSEQQMFASSNHSCSAYQTSGVFSAPGKSKFQLHGKGVGEYSGVLQESQDFHRALSLLSTSSSDPLVQPHSQPFSLLFSYDGLPK